MTNLLHTVQTTLKKFDIFLEENNIKKYKEYDFQINNSYEDFMVVDEENEIIYFNSQNSDDLKFYLTCIIHEYYHAVVQNIPNKTDINKIKNHLTDGRWYIVRADLEADSITWRFLKNELKITLEELLEIQYKSNINFDPKKPVNEKIARTIGTIAAIYDLYLKNENAIYFPSFFSFSQAEIIFIEKRTNATIYRNAEMTEEFVLSGLLVNVNLDNKEMSFHRYNKEAKKIYDFINALFLK